MTPIWAVWRRRRDQMGYSLVALYWNVDDALRRMRAEVEQYVNRPIVANDLITEVLDGTTTYQMVTHDVGFYVEPTEVLGSPLAALAAQAEG